MALDKQAWRSCKGKNKYWYGYKGNVSVDMQWGLTNKIATTPASVTDAQEVQHICPSQASVYGDQGLLNGAFPQNSGSTRLPFTRIKRNNMKNKNKDPLVCEDEMSLRASFLTA